MPRGRVRRRRCVHDGLHRHGTDRMYCVDRCRCVACYVARSRVQKINRHRVAVAGARSSLTAVPAVGIVRRLQALAAVGWSAEDLAPPLGTAAPNVRRWQRGVHGWVTPAVAGRVRAVYDAVWDEPPPGRYPLKVRRLAAARGWVPPLAWDDDTIDDPAAQPRLGNGVSLVKAPRFDEVAVERIMAGTLSTPLGVPSSPELVEAVRRLAASGLSDAEVGRRVGRRGDAVGKIRERHGILAGVPATRLAVAS